MVFNMKVSTKIQFDIYDVLPSPNRTYPLVQVYPHGRTSRTSTQCWEDILLPLPFVLSCLKKMYDGENLAKSLVSTFESGKGAYGRYKDLSFTLKANLPVKGPHPLPFALENLLALNDCFPEGTKVRNLDVFTIQLKGKL